MAELLGLDYSGALVCNRSTHLVLASTDLILSEGNAKSQKLDRAKEWGIAIVTYAWLEDSVARGKILDVEIYLVHVSLQFHCCGPPYYPQWEGLTSWHGFRQMSGETFQGGRD